MISVVIDLSQEMHRPERVTLWHTQREDHGLLSPLTNVSFLVA